MTSNPEDIIPGIVEHLLSGSSRINEAKAHKYWYPLSLATYGVEEIIEALDSMIRFRTTMWEKTRKFEMAFSAFQGCSHSVMVNSGSSANLLLSFLMTNPARPRLKPGDEVLVPAVTWPTQVWAPMMAGLKVRLVDVDPGTLNVCTEDLRRKIGPRTGALFLVHLLGNPCDMDLAHDLAKEHDLFLLEDCCEALGAEWDGTKVGNFGAGGTFSFFFSHHVTTMEGGMVVTNDPDSADHLRILRAHGWLRNVEEARYPSLDEGIDPRYAFVNWGFNLRPTEIQAGFGLRQLEKLPGFTSRRDELASRFFRSIDGWPWLERPIVAPKARPVWMALPVMVAEDAPFQREDLLAHLEAEGVETRPIVTGDITRHPAARLFPGLVDGELPGAKAVHERGFYVGLSPMSRDEDLERLLDCFGRFLRRFV